MLVATEEFISISTLIRKDMCERPQEDVDVVVGAMKMKK